MREPKAVPTKDYDLIVLGGGKGGKTLASKYARANKSVALIERSAQMIGGTCINLACIPTKAFITAARTLLTCREASYFGIACDTATPDWPRIKGRVESLVSQMRQFNLDNFENTPNLDLIMGEGHFVDERSIRVGTDLYKAPYIVVNTGSRPALPDIPGLAEHALTSDTIQRIDSIPEHLIVLGAGYIALEFAQLFAILGSRVTIVNRGSQILTNEDPDAAHAITEALKACDIEIISDAKTMQITKTTGTAYQVDLQIKDRPQSLTGSHVLAALGRTPNTEAIAADKAKLELDPRGFIRVDEHLRAILNKNIFAIGDVNGGPQFTHISFDDHRIVLDQLNQPHTASRSAHERQVPSTLFIEPEYARVGLTEKQAKQKNIDYAIAHVPMSVVPRAKVANQTQGYMKALIDRKTKQIIGFTAFGIDAGNIMAVVQMAMAADLTYDRVRDFVFAHPTMPEGLIDLFTTVKLS